MLKQALINCSNLQAPWEIPGPAGLVILWLCLCVCMCACVYKWHVCPCVCSPMSTFMHATSWRWGGMKISSPRLLGLRSWVENSSQPFQFMASLLSAPTPRLSRWRLEGGRSEKIHVTVYISLVKRLSHKLSSSGIVCELIDEMQSRIAPEAAHSGSGELPAASS